MNFVLFYHSVLSDWNHGNAHFLRGIASELAWLGHRVTIYEPANAWSVVNLVSDHGEAALLATHARYPALKVVRYSNTLDLDRALDRADVVIVHEWNPHELVSRIGAHHARRPGGVLLFHDTHHRSVSQPGSMAAYDFSRYDGVLAFGEVIRQRYLAQGWASRAWTWHEAADTTVFRPRPEIAREADVVWIGNWGDDERAAELRELLFEPVAALHVSATVHGVRYPAVALRALADAGIAYKGWLANYRVPEVFARHRVTLHIPRRPYVQALPGIPTIRPFEALACGIPLVSGPWSDEEGLFRPGTDYLLARDGQEMTRHLRAVLNDTDLAATLAARGRETVLARHTCRHRVDELLAIIASIRGRTVPPRPQQAGPRSTREVSA